MNKSFVQANVKIGRSKGSELTKTINSIKQSHMASLKNMSNAVATAQKLKVPDIVIHTSGK